MKNMTDVNGECLSAERMLERDGKYRVSWLPEGDNQPRTCMKTKVVYLPRPLWNWTDHERKIWRGYRDHEFGHHDETQDALVELMDREGISYGSKLGICINGIDDVWQEAIRSRKYTGCAQDLSYMQADAMNRASDAYASGAADPTNFVNELLGLCYTARSKWQPDVALGITRYNSFVSDKYHHHVDAVNALVDMDDSYAAAEELLRICKDIIREDGGDPDSKDMKDPNGKASAGKNSEDGKSEGSEKAKAEAAEIIASYKDMVGHVHDDADEEGEGAPIKIIYDHVPSNNYVPYTWEEIDYGVPEGHVLSRQRDRIEQVYEDNRKVSKSIARLFQSYSQTRKQYQLKRGKLTAKHLTRGFQGDPRVFNKKDNRVDENSAVYVIGDGSGSMAGGPYSAMGAALMSLSEAMLAAKIPLKVCTFTEVHKRLKHRVIEDWHERFDRDRMLDRLGTGRLSQNADGDNVLIAYNELLQRSEPRKILIVLSDGMPACLRWGDAHTFLKNVTSSIIADGRVELYGVGIMTEAVKEFYPEYSVLEDSKQIEECLVEVVKRKLIRV